MKVGFAAVGNNRVLRYRPRSQPSEEFIGELRRVGVDEEIIRAAEASAQDATSGAPGDDDASRG